MQPQESFVSSTCSSFWAHRLGTFLGTLGVFFARSVQKTEEKPRQGGGLFDRRLSSMEPLAHALSSATAWRGRLTLADERRRPSAERIAGLRFENTQRSPEPLHSVPSAALELGRDRSARRGAAAQRN